jgi:hypothetical protein
LTGQAAKKPSTSSGTTAMQRRVAHEARRSRMLRLANRIRVAEKVGMAYERDFTDDFGPCMIYSRSLAIGA